MNVARRALAGLDAGVTGSLGVMVWFLFHSWARGDVWYSKFNIAAGIFFGNRVFQSGLSFVTIVGVAAIVVLYSIVGIPAAWIIPARSGYLLRFASALLFTSGLHFAFDLWVWPHLSPFASTYFPRSATVPAHIIYAACLVRLPGRLKALADFGAHSASPSPSGPFG